MASDEEHPFDLAVFLKEESELFTLLGVFGAISLYLAQFPIKVESRWVNIGIVSSLLIFITVALGIRGRLQAELDRSIFDFVIKPRRESLQVLFFVVPFYLLAFSVLLVAIQFRTAGQFVGQSILVFIGITTVLYAIITGEELIGFDDLGEVGRDRSVLNFGRYLLAIGLVGVVLASLGILHIQNQFNYGPSDFIAVRSGPGLVPFILSYLVGVVAGSALYVFIAVMLYILHWMIRRIDQSGQAEAFKRGYQTLFGKSTSDRQAEMGEFNDEN